MGWQEKVSGVLHASQRVFGEGEVVTYQPRSGPAYAVQDVVFRRASLALDVETGLQVISADPEATLPLDHLLAFPGEGDRVELRDARWQVIDPRDDGEGGCKVRLRRTV